MSDGPAAVSARLVQLLTAGTPAVLLTLVEGPPPLVPGAALLLTPGAPRLGTLGDQALDHVAARDALGELAAGRTRLRRYGPRGEAGLEEVGVFVQSFVAPPRLVVVGAVDVADALSRVAGLLGYQVIVGDARAVFATSARFPAAHAVVVDRPGRLIEQLRPVLGPRDAVCVLTHDPRWDVPALVAALGTAAGYVGAMGSRRTHVDRLERLRAAGVGEGELARLRSPIGLDLGGVTPEETAVAICAEMVADRNGRDVVLPLRATSGDIHDR